MPLTTEDFIFQLTSKYLPDLNCKNKDIFLYGRKKGWLEDEDERFSQNYITRRSAARIIHQFMKIELKIPDISDITPAEVLTDLYTCRICLNHIAQVYLQNLMEVREISRDGQLYLIFDHLGLVEKKDLLYMFNKLDSITGQI